MINDENRTEHESFGIAGFSRSSRGGDGTTLFGSSIKHNNTITFKVFHAEHLRRHHEDRFHAKDRTPIVEIEMSQTQFADMITSMNIGDGSPVTIRRIQEKRMGDCPHENKRMQHSKEFKDRMVEFGNSLTQTKADIYSMLEKRLPKKDQHDLKNMLDGMIQEIRSNIPFFENQFAEQMDKTVTEAKGEVEAFITNKIMSTGLNALQMEQGGANNKIIELE